jgi:hypothetical protein
MPIIATLATERNPIIANIIADDINEEPTAVFGIPAYADTKPAVSFPMKSPE